MGDHPGPIGRLQRAAQRRSRYARRAAARPAANGGQRSQDCRRRGVAAGTLRSAALQPSVAAVQQPESASGYDGAPVVLIGGSDIPAYQRLSLVTVDMLRKIGFKVDLQLSDWGSVATRRQKKDPPAQGGWNLFHTSANGA